MRQVRQRVSRPASASGSIWFSSTRVAHPGQEGLKKAVAFLRDVVIVWEKDPSVQAFTDLLNRAIDKPIERTDVQVTDDWEKRAARLASARYREG